jgi:hypothetical protein
MQIEKYESIQRKVEEMEKRELEFSQTRSNFVLEKFICKGEYTPLTQWRALSHNSYVAMTEVRRLILENERQSRKIKILEEDKPLNWDLDILQAQHIIQQNEVRLSGLGKEIDFMEKLCKVLEEKNGKPFTAKQKDEEESKYWKLRLTNQMLQSVEGHRTGTGEGNIASLINAMDEGIIDSDINKVDTINYTDINQIALHAFDNKKELQKLLFDKGE